MLSAYPHNQENGLEMEKLRPHQKKALDIAREAIKSDKNKNLVSMPVGTGKTAVIAALCKRATRKLGKAPNP